MTKSAPRILVNGTINNGSSEPQLPGEIDYEALILRKHKVVIITAPQLVLKKLSEIGIEALEKFFDRLVKDIKRQLESSHHEKNFVPGDWEIFTSVAGEILTLTRRKNKSSWLNNLRPIEELFVSGGIAIDDAARESIEYRGVIYPFRGLMVVLPCSPKEPAIDSKHIMQIVEELKAQAKLQKNKLWASLVSRKFKVYLCEKATISQFDEQANKTKGVTLDAFEYDDIKDTIEFEMIRQRKLMK